MDIGKNLIKTLIILLFISSFSFSVYAVETQNTIVLPNGSKTIPPPPPLEPYNYPLGITIKKSSLMRSSGARVQTPLILDQIQRLGYREVSDNSMSFLTIDSVKNKFIPIENIKNNITSSLSTMSIKTGFYKAMIFSGAIPRNPVKETGKWTSISRYYTFPDGGVLMLTESDFRAAKSRIIIPEELFNTEVNGSPAILMSSRTTTGKFFTKLTWYTSNKVYTLHLTGRPRGVGVKNELVVLAKGILD